MCGFPGSLATRVTASKAPVTILMSAQGYASPPSAMAAARPESVDLLGDFEEEEKLPWKLSTKQTVKLKLQSNILANRKSFELWNATFRADIGKYVVFLDHDLPSVEEWCLLECGRAVSDAPRMADHGSFTAAGYVKFAVLWKRRDKLAWNYGSPYSEGGSRPSVFLSDNL